MIHLFLRTALIVLVMHVVLLFTPDLGHSYGEKGAIEIPFSDQDVMMTFSANDWEDASELSFSSATGGNNTILLKYLAERKELVVAFLTTDTSPEGPDTLLIAIDVDKDGDRKLDANDYSFSFKRDGSDEFFAVSNEDWYPQRYPGLRDSQQPLSNGWLVIWRIPISLKEDEPIGLTASQFDHDNFVSFPAGANDLDPRTWATLIPKTIIMKLQPEKLNRGEATTITVRTFQSSPSTPIAFQYQKSNTTEGWSNLFSGSPKEGKIEIKWVPPSTGEYRLRAIWNKSDIQTATISAVKKLDVSKAQQKLDLMIHPNPVFFDDDVNLTLTMSGLDTPSSALVDIFMKSNSAGEWILFQRAPVEKGFFTFIWRANKSPGNYTLRAMWDQNDKTPPLSSDVKLTVLPDSSQLAALKASLNEFSEAYSKAMHTNNRQSTELTQVLNAAQRRFLVLNDTNQALEKRISDLDAKISRVLDTADNLGADRIKEVTGWVVAIIAAGAALIVLRRKTRE